MSQMLCTVVVSSFVDFHFWIEEKIFSCQYSERFFLYWTFKSTAKIVLKFQIWNNCVCTDILGEAIMHRSMVWFILQISLAPRGKELCLQKLELIKVKIINAEGWYRNSGCH
jgi:hypothetical protein